MCGRYTLRTPAARLMEVFGVSALPALVPRYNIAPTQMVLCIRSSGEHPEQREGVLMRWGLIPFWAKDMSIANRMINARAETIAEKPAFRTAFSKRRCLIPADGFYEWQKLSTGKKQPWWMHQEDEQPFALAGLWETWTPSETSPETTGDESSDDDGKPEPILSCTILTTDANKDMSVLHDRMPVILPVEAWSTWLSSQAGSGQLRDLLLPAPNGQLVRTCVSTVVNRPVLDDPECLTPVSPPEPL